VSNRKRNQNASVTLTVRDLSILQKLNAAGWLTTPQIRNYFFPDKSTNAVCKRLRKLVAGNYLAMARTSSTESGLYRLAGQGKLALLERSESSEEEISIPTQLPRKLKHFMSVNDLRFHFEQRIEGAGVQLLYFFSERELCRYYQNPRSISDSLVALLKHYKIIPDALAKVGVLQEGDTRELSFALEYDAGTEHVTFFGRTKIKQYTALFSSGYGHTDDLKVLTFADSIKRVVSLMRQTVQHEPPRHLFYFALMGKLEQHCWMKAGIFLDPYDFFVPVRRGAKVEIVERDIHKDALPNYALIALPAASPRSPSSREEREAQVTDENTRSNHEAAPAII